MADHISPEARSANMSRIRAQNTKPELYVRQLLHRAGYRFRLHRHDLPGKPDIYLPRYRLAIFVHGCFWHGHEGCKRSKLPSTRREFWTKKIQQNRQRDHLTVDRLANAGITSVTVWECELKTEGNLLARIDAHTGRG